MSFQPKYILATAARYKINIARIGFNPYDPTTVKNKGDFRDVEITRPNIQTDLECLHTHALMTVNGYIHPTVWMDGRLYIKEATPSMLRINQRTNKLGNNIGLISFMGLKNGIEKIEITEEMIRPAPGPNGNYPLVEKLVIDFGKKVDGVFLVFMGYMISEQEGYMERLSDSSFILYMDALKLHDRILELLNNYDIFNELGVEVSPYNDSAVKMGDLASDETVIKMLTRYNTFLVHFKGQKVSYRKKPLEYSAIPNSFQVSTKPRRRLENETDADYELSKGGFNKEILIGGWGKIIEYKAKEFNIYKTAILTVDATYNELNISYVPNDPEKLTSNNRRLLKQYQLSNCFFLEMNIDKA